MIDRFKTLAAVASVLAAFLCEPLHAGCKGP